MAKIQCCFTLAIAAAQQLDVEESFSQFITTYNKTYTGEEYGMRFQVFKENMDRAKDIQILNPAASFGVTKFSDMQPEEFAFRHGLRYPSDWKHRGPSKIFSAAEIKAAPDSFDWREHGALAAPQEQGHCGSCWAFSAVANMEAQHFIATGVLTKLSEQELVSCDTQDGGCQGGLMDQAFSFVEAQRSGEVVTDEFYPYKSGDGTTRGCGGVSGDYPLCRGLSGAATDAWCTQFCYDPQGKALCSADLCDCSSTGQNVGATISSHVDLPQDEDQLAAWLAQNGPISIGVGVPLGAVWQGYTGGIMTASECPAASPNHGVLLVGYNKPEGYWVVRNSWGPNFGEDGYIRLAYGTNTCNLVFSPSSSKVSSTVEV